MLELRGSWSGIGYPRLAMSIASDSDALTLLVKPGTFG
jgi:hypothetical protein